MADFGWSNFFSEQEKRFTYGGTPGIQSFYY